MEDNAVKSNMLAALLTAGFIAGPAIAQDTGSRQTREFVQAAGESDTFEIMEAYSALAQSKDPQVRAFAQQMIHDHSETSRQLREATTRAGLKPPPMAVGSSLSPFLASLQSQRGAEFDKVYWQQQALAHRAALTVEQRYAADGDNPELRRTAAGAIPLIQAHLSVARLNSAKIDSGS